jgi:hypothetical protein
MLFCISKLFQKLISHKHHFGFIFQILNFIFSHIFASMTIEQLKDIKDRRDALRRHL